MEELKKEKLDFEAVRKKRIRRWCSCFILLAVLLFFLVFISFTTGSVSISYDKLFSSKILTTIRMPRTLMAVIAGGALATAGFLLQTFFSNPLAGPYVLGISSAAKVTVAITMIFFINSFSRLSSLVLIAAAFAGSLLATGIILVIAGRINHIASLLLCGVMIGYICSAICDFVITFADERDIVNMHDWSKGSFSGTAMDDVMTAAVIVLSCVIVCMCITRSLSALRLGEEYALSVGINIKLLRRLIIILSALLAATVTAFAGPISFVGIAVPVIIRRIFNTTEPVVLIPAVFLGGAAFMLLCDVIARCAFAPLELSISSVTAMLGAPVVIVTLIKRSRQTL